MAPAVRWVVALALLAAGCDRLAAPAPQPPLSDAAQRTAADQLAHAFAGACLTASDAQAATRVFEAQGWPRFTTVWNDLDGVFYATKPSRAFPGSLWVLSDNHPAGKPTWRVTCVGHYPALGGEPMVAAIERHWGVSLPGPAIYRGSRMWAFHLKNGALTAWRAPVDPPGLAAELAGLGPGEAYVYAQMFYNRPIHDVASLVSVSGPRT